MLSVLTVNIGAASRDRAELMLNWLAGRPEQVFLLTETSAGRGTAYLLDQLRGAGFSVVKTPDDGDRGAALVSRIALLDDQPVQLDKVTIPGRVAAAMLDTQPRVCLAGVYVPSRDRSVDKTDRKEHFIGTLLDALQALPAEQRNHLVLGGDYNVISRTHQPLHAGFLPFEFAMLETLQACGFVDAFEQCAPGVQAYSWIGRTGDGYRYDYVHVADGLSKLIVGCEYLHETRARRLTDHAAVTVTLEIEGVPLDTADPTETGEIALF